jgi:hypothetical protein
VSTYISERSCLEKAYESPKRAASNYRGKHEEINTSPEREVKAGHLIRIPHSRNTSKLHHSKNASLSQNCMTDKFLQSSFNNNPLMSSLAFKT